MTAPVPPMEGLIDRLAARAVDAWNEHAGPYDAASFGFATLSEHSKNIARAQVRAVLAELREPTEAMRQAGRFAGAWSDNVDLAQTPDIHADDARDVWTAMIDAALSEPDRTGGGR